MPSRADVAILRGGQERAAQQARNELAGWWATTSKSDLTKFRAEVERFFPLLVESYGEVAATAAADWYDMIYAERPAWRRACVTRRLLVRVPGGLSGRRGRGTPRRRCPRYS